MGNIHHTREEWEIDGGTFFRGPVAVDETYMGGKEQSKHGNKKSRAGRGAVGKTAVVGGKAPGKAHRVGLSIVAPEPTQRLPEYARNNETAEKWITEIRWPDGPRCPYCDSDKVQYPTAHKTMTHRCRSKGCRKSFSTKTGTVMQGSKVTYQQWAIAVLLMTNLKGVSSMTLHRDLKLTPKTAWHLAHRLREAWALDPPSRTYSWTKHGWVPV